MIACRMPRRAAAGSTAAVLLLMVCIAGLQPAAARPAVVDCLEAFGPQCKQCTASRCTAVKQPKQFTIKGGNVVPEAGFQPGASPDTAEPCPAGTHKPRPGAEPCQPCSGGQKYQPGTGQTECKQCPTGRVVDDARTTCTKVVAGPGQQPSPSGPEPCPAGTAKAAAGDSKCARCRGGQSYQPLAGQTACDTCPAGGKVDKTRTTCTLPPTAAPVPSLPPPVAETVTSPPPSTSGDFSPRCSTISDGTVCTNGNNAYLVNKFVLAADTYDTCAAEGELRGETWALADLLGGADAEAGVTRADLASLALSCSGPCGTFGHRGDTETGAGGTVATLRSWIAGAETCTTLRWCDAYVPGGAGSYTASTTTCSQAGAFGIARSEPGNCYLQGRKTVLCAECPTDCRACDPAMRTCSRCLDGFDLVDGACIAQ